MKENKFIYFLIFLSFFLVHLKIAKSEIIILSECDDKQDEFLKNEYILNLKELIMTRNYTYNEKTYRKHRLTDLSVKKSNTYVRNIYLENNNIFTHKHGYPQFYTQIFFIKGEKKVFMKTVLNNEEGISKISNCKKIDSFSNKS
ncbi:hypothetical protein N9U81_01925 [Candidatus Pelagibacter sp.]|nr:hypothetical protein [Candidatus Pelagibacter sp.]